MSAGSNYDLYVSMMTGNVGIYTSRADYLLDIAVGARFSKLYAPNIGIGTTLVPSDSIYIASNCTATSYVMGSYGYVQGTTTRANQLNTARSISGITFDGTQNISFSNLTIEPYLGASSTYNGSSATAFAPFTDSAAATASNVVSRDAGGSFSVSNLYLDNVGIGTTVARQAFDVAGGVANITGNILINNTAGTNGQFLQSQGNQLAWATPGGSTTQTSNYVLSAGTSFTIPIGCIMMYVQMWGAGGGGGGGTGIRNNSTAQTGGGGGASGQYLSFLLSKPQWGSASTLTYAIGTAGTSGSSGANGGTGGNTTLTLNGVTITATGGGGGNTTGTGGTAATEIANSFLYLQYGNSLAGGTSIGTGAGAPGSNATLSYGPGSGAAGGGANGTNTGYNGGQGGATFQITTTLTGGSVGIGTTSTGTFAGRAGGIGSNVLTPQINTNFYSFGIGGSGGGGGGGALSTSGAANVTGGAGGAGGAPGGGGGGGGAGMTTGGGGGSGTGGAGGTGGSGLIIITCF